MEIGAGCSPAPSPATPDHPACLKPEAPWGFLSEIVHAGTAPCSGLSIPTRPCCIQRSPMSPQRRPRRGPPLHTRAQRPSGGRPLTATARASPRVHGQARPPRGAQRGRSGFFRSRSRGRALRLRQDSGPAPSPRPTHLVGDVLGLGGGRLRGGGRPAHHLGGDGGNLARGLGEGTRRLLSSSRRCGHVTRGRNQGAGRRHLGFGVPCGVAVAPQEGTRGAGRRAGRGAGSLATTRRRLGLRAQRRCREGAPPPGAGIVFPGAESHGPGRGRGRVSPVGWARRVGR